MDKKTYIIYDDKDFIARDGIVEKYRNADFFEPGRDKGDGACIKACKAALVLLGKNSSLSDRMKREYALIKSGRLPVLAIKIFSNYDCFKPEWLNEEIVPLHWNIINGFLGYTTSPV